MDKLVERINEIEDAINQLTHSIFLLEEERELIQETLSEIHIQQRQSEDRAWRQMKL